MARTVTVCLRPADKRYSFNAGELELKPGDMVVVETEKGLELARVAEEPQEGKDSENEGKRSLRPVLRMASSDDVARRDELLAQAEDALAVARHWVHQLELPMKFTSAHYTLDAGQAFLFFLAEERVDFRQLLRHLNEILGVRVELRQIGTRDEAKIAGGLGRCGRLLCCTQWLTSFSPVTIRMAKEQSLPISAEGLSGQCGRLRCCLKYECEQYREMNKLMPRTNETVGTPQGEGRVREAHPIKETVSVRFAEGEVREFPLDSITRKERHDKRGK